MATELDSAGLRCPSAVTPDEGKTRRGRRRPPGRQALRLPVRRAEARRPSKCTKPRWLRARGTNAWRLDVRGTLRRGTYAFFVRGYDRAGNVTPARRGIRFRVR